MNIRARIKRLERELKRRRPENGTVYIISSAFLPRIKGSDEPTPGDVVFIVPPPGEKERPAR
ncbi:MAG: hypothetical protein BWY80_01049 [Firmicutes bacterium ADurb.Bin456]|nr:MAG: hypothetical protein BWY80_01049 [Firmicutes bacterium ADurb.Bin456]